MLKTPEIRDEIRSSPETLCIYYQLGNIVARPEPLSGGYLHKLWRVETQEGSFVIKKLNPAIMEKRGMAGRLEQAESIGAAFREAGIPAIIPYAHDGSFITEMDDASYLLYPFVSGSLYDLKRVSKSQASQVAGLLARMHTLHLLIQKEVGLHYDIVPQETWRDLMAQCTGKDLSFSQDFERLLPFSFIATSSMLRISMSSTHTLCLASATCTQKTFCGKHPTCPTSSTGNMQV